jgi:hypothetical protein
MIKTNTDKIFYSGLSFVFIALCVVAFTTEGTGGGGDSIAHYFIARFSWSHPSLFLDHWGKPLFTSIGSVFAQFGFKAIKFFNIIVTIIACHFSFLIAKHFKLKNAAWIVVLYFFSPETIRVTLSGLTEPLFALVLILGIFFMVKSQRLTATILLSFLPFARSEGLVILCLVFVYLLYIKEYKLLPWLIFGHLFMGIAGVFMYHDILWVFNKLPYARLDSVYGHGSWKHFIVQLYYIIGPLLYALLIVSFVSFGLNLRKGFWTKVKDQILIDKAFFFYGMFLIFFFAHTFFWTLGIFGSLGLTRVFVGVIPVIALLSLEGLNTIFDLLEKYHLTKFKMGFIVFVFAALIFFCFVNKKTFVDYKHGFVLNEDQKVIAHEVVPFFQQKYPTYKPYFSDIGFAYFFDIDVFGKEGSYQIRDIKNLNELSDKNLIIWDGWFSRVEERIAKDSLLHIPNLKLDTTFKAVLKNNDTIDYCIFLKK